tara:strand:- start:480 stop:596 length:117 start_codon:yes stop_codon:yes gene_type:complete
MPNINIEIPDELHKRLKITSAKKGVSLKERVIELLKKR